MKIGVLCEGEKTDQPALQALLEHKFPKTTFEVKGMTKKRLYEAGDIELETLFANGADRALIIWDLFPANKQYGIPVQWSEKPNRKEQRQMLLERLRQSNVLRAKLQAQAHALAHRYEFTDTPHDHPNNGDDLFKLVCICFSFEGWLLSDHGILCNLASTAAHRVERLESKPDPPDRCINPVAALTSAFKKAPCKKYRFYNKSDHNIDIMKAYIEEGKVDKMRASRSYCRVIDEIAKWVQP